jgi:argininosuccinate lyase
VHNTPFGDIVDTEDDLQPLVASMFHDALRAVTLVGAAMAGADFDVERLRSRAAEGGTTLTELADHLVRQHGISFRTAHGIAARLLVAWREHPEAPLGTMLAAASSGLLGAPLLYSDAEVARILSPQHFVEVRKTHGGPAPSETARALEESRRQLAADRGWLERVTAATTAATARLKQRSQAL